MTIVDGSTYTGMYAADGSINAVPVSGDDFSGIQDGCGAINIVIVSANWDDGAIHPCGALVVTQDPDVKGAYLVTFTDGVVDNTLEAPVLDWQDNASLLLPVFTIEYDAHLNDIIYLRRSTTADFLCYEDVIQTVDDLTPSTVYFFDFEDPAWAEQTWYVKSFYSRNGQLSEESDVETFLLDATGPALITPVDTSTGTTTANLSATTQEDAVTVYTVVTTSATPPSAAQIAAGDDHADANAAYASSALKATAGAQAFSATGLSPSTAYYTYFTGKDANDNFGAVLSADGFTTDADDLAFEGVQAKLNASLTSQNITGLTLLSWNGTDILDVTGWHDPSTNPSRITIPSGVAYVQFFGQVGLQNATANEVFDVLLRKNGSAITTGQVSASLSSGHLTPSWQIASYPMAVTPGDYFEMQVQVAADTSVDILASRSWFTAMKVG